MLIAPGWMRGEEGLWTSWSRHMSARSRLDFYGFTEQAHSSVLSLCFVCRRTSSQTERTRSWKRKSVSFMRGTSRRGTERRFEKLHQMFLNDDENSALSFIPPSVKYTEPPLTELNIFLLSLPQGVMQSTPTALQLTADKLCLARWRWNTTSSSSRGKSKNHRRLIFLNFECWFLH